MEPDDDPGVPPPEPPTTRPSLLRVVGRDVYADWDAVYLDNVSRIYSVMYAKVGNRPDAEDLTAEVFVAALGPMRVGSSRGEVRAYLLATARTVLAGYWRKRLGVQVTTIDPEAETAPPVAWDAPSDSPERARRILGNLPDRYRRILELRFLHAMTVKEAATEMDVSVANAKVLQHRALRMAANGVGVNG